MSGQGLRLQSDRTHIGPHLSSPSPKSLITFLDKNTTSYWMALFYFLPNIWLRKPTWKTLISFCEYHLLQSNNLHHFATKLANLSTLNTMLSKIYIKTNRLIAASYLMKRKEIISSCYTVLRFPSLWTLKRWLLTLNNRSVAHFVFAIL